MAGKSASSDHKDEQAISFILSQKCNGTLQTFSLKFAEV